MERKCRSTEVEPCSKFSRKAKSEGREAERRRGWERSCGRGNLGSKGRAVHGSRAATILSHSAQASSGESRRAGCELQRWRNAHNWGVLPRIRACAGRSATPTDGPQQRQPADSRMRSLTDLDAPQARVRWLEMEMRFIQINTPPPARGAALAARLGRPPVRSQGSSCRPPNAKRTTARNHRPTKDPDTYDFPMNDTFGFPMKGDSQWNETFSTRRR